MEIDLLKYGLHHYRPEYGPFHNICALSDEEAEHILQEIRERYHAHWLVPSYLQERRIIEEWLYTCFLAKGGQPAIHHPIYVSVGEARAPNYHLNSSEHVISVPFDLFDSATISFTYPDSMFSYGLSHHLDDPRAQTRHTYHGVVFTREEIKQVVAQYGFPGEEGKQHLQSPLDHRSFIEAQLWDLEPLEKLMK